MFEVGKKVRESRRRREKEAMLGSSHTDARKVNVIELSHVDFISLCSVTEFFDKVCCNVKTIFFISCQQRIPLFPLKC